MVNENEDVKLEDSILLTVKKALGLDAELTAFDPDIIMFINSSLMSLNQLGIGPEEGFRIETKAETWDDFTTALKLLSAVQTYVYTFVKLLFDPPATSFGQESLRTIQKEQLWRLNVQTETERINNER